MRYFSGFGFLDDEELFGEFLTQGEYCIAGFSYGAQKAMNEALTHNGRIQKLQLLSPAFFDDKSEAFKRAQLRAFKRDSRAYLERFFMMCGGGDEKVRKYFIGGGEEELRALLYYKWQAREFALLQSRGIEIEVLLGDSDEIINSQAALSFFRPLVTRILWFKGKNHLLRTRL